MLTLEEKQSLIKEFGVKDNDCGSSAVQVALLSGQIKKLAEHLKKFPKDKHSRRGLICMIGRRRAFLKYIKRRDAQSHSTLVDKFRQNSYL